MAETKLLGLRTVIYAAPDELGLDPDLPLAEGSTITYWGVDSIAVSVQHFLDLGARIHAQIQHVGDGIHVAALKDPFGNVVGLIENPHFSL